MKKKWNREGEIVDITLNDRSEETVVTYFNRTRDAQVRRFLPQKAVSVEEALVDYHKTQLPGSTSYGRTIYADGVYIGDIWCYCIQKDEPNAMVSYCIFDRTYWGKGIATAALKLFLLEIGKKYDFETVGAFTYAANQTSIRVLEACGFEELEDFVEEGIESKYFQRKLR